MICGAANSSPNAYSILRLLLPLIAIVMQGNALQFVIM